MKILTQMKAIPKVILFLGALAPFASASVATFGPSNQNLTVTGLGANSSGEGQDRLTLGNCVFNGTNTVCTLTAPFTGIGPGGTISFVLTYPGNGPSPLTVVSQSPGSDILGSGRLTTGSILTTISESNGTTLIYNGQLFIFFYGQSGAQPPQCTGVSICGIGQVGLNVGATISGQITGTFDPTPVISAVENAANFQVKSAAAPATPNSIVSVYVTNLVSTQGLVSGANLFPQTSFQGVQVLFNGVAAPLYFVSGAANLINLAVPSNLPTTGSAILTVQTLAGSSANFTLPLAPTDVGVFRLQADPAHPNNGAVEIPSSQWLVVPASTAAAYGLTACTGLPLANICGQPAPRGSNIVLYLTGGGLATPNGTPSGAPVASGSVAPLNGSTIYDTVQTPAVTIGGLSAPILFSGVAPGTAAEYQINTTIPMTVTPGDSVPVVVTYGNTSDTVTIAVQ